MVAAHGGFPNTSSYGSAVTRRIKGFVQEALFNVALPYGSASVT
ncbi:MAG: hypothetical protein AVDCRST_MAG86-2752 [uncultured Truepera sp.]|uniref:Uncharacterized protein n=1 Tax=uncultured Truepera sp. TaxID=543023 RepID=A0A6J4VJR6_9DEIN|nr:MAG: hypothetical protein AVDCRST_MAG86-2752 [uncultured Truepera sp.]